MFAKQIGLIREEWYLALCVGTAAIFLAFGQGFAAVNATVAGSAIVFAVLFVIVLGACMSVVRHAEHLAHILGEPYGTLILTISVTVIEVMAITAMSLHGHNPALVRDTVFAVIMILLNGMVGLCLLFGAWRHREQNYNLQGANAYLGVIIPLTVLGLILPDFTMTTPGPILSTTQEAYIATISLGLYAIFLVVQTIRHRSYFVLGDPQDASDHDMPHSTQHRPAIHAVLLIAYMMPLVILAEQLATPVDLLLETLHAPPALGGAVIALLVATPEAAGAVRAAAANQLQRSMNIFLGAVLATISLTIPAMLAFSQITGEKIALGLAPPNAILLMLTLMVSLVTFASGRTNVLQGAVHLVLFGTYILLLFQS